MSLHPSTEHVLQYFKYDHLREDLQSVVEPIAAVAQLMAESLPQGPELTTGLRKLLEAKDCFVRSAL